MEPKVVDLFCGAGGLTRGFVDEGFNVVAGIDLDPNASYPYGSNNDAEFLRRDVRSFTGGQLDDLFSDCKLRILAGCAPCQPFSTYTQGVVKDEDKRWELLDHFARLIKEATPEVVTMENVPRLLNHSRFQDFLTVLYLCGYWIWCDVVRCADYGVPQTRKRLVLLASRLGPISFERPSSANSKPTVREAIGNLNPIRDGEQDPSDPLHRAATLGAKNKERIRASRPGGTWREWPNGLRADCHKIDVKMSYVSVYGRMSWDKPAPTLTTEFFGIGHGRFGHPEQDRAISLREGAILQTFPRDYAFSRGGKPSIISTSRLIGNAVPVMLGRAIARSIKRHLSNHV